MMFLNAIHARGGDFLVFFRAARHLLEGDAVYSVARDGSFCFKYPPWIATVLLPLGFFTEVGAGIFWRLLTIGGVLYLFQWVIKRSESPTIPALVALSFWGFWVQHLVTGQSVILLTAMTLFASGFLVDRPGKPSASFALGWGLSTKIFPLVTLGALRLSEWTRTRIILVIVVSLALSLPILEGYHWNLVEAAHQFKLALTFQNIEIGGGYYGLPSGFAHLFGLDVTETGSRLRGWVPSVLLTVVFFWRLHQSPTIRTSISHRMAYGLALASAIQPLTFTYSFVAMYPATALALDSAFKNGRNGLRSHLAKFLTVLGWFSITFLHSQAADRLGLTVVLYGEFPPKAVGTFLLVAGALIVDAD